MLKEPLILIAIFTLSACSLSPQPAYKISDIHTQTFIMQNNALAKCLFPNEFKTQKMGTLSEENKMLYTAMQATLLEGIIGKNNINIVLNDPLSLQYFSQQYWKFNNSAVPNFDEAWCKEAKSAYKATYKIAKEKVKQQKAEQKAREAYLASPAGQAELAQQRMLMQQQQMHNEMMVQQQRIHTDMQIQQQQMQLQMQQQQIQNQFNLQMQQMRIQNSKIGRGWAW